MKRTSLFRKIAVISASAAAVCPIVLSATACTPTKLMVDSYDFDSIADFTGDKFSTNYSSVSFKQMLYGNRKFHNGNYMVISGASAYSNISLFFANQDRIRDRNLWYKKDYFMASALYNGVVDASKESDKMCTHDIGFYNAIDFFDGVVYDGNGHKIYVCDDNGNIRDASIRPFEKWTPNAIAETQKYNSSEENPDGPYDWNDDDSITTDDYIRNDTAAVAFRAFSNLGALLYPKKEEGEGRKNTLYTDDSVQKGQILFFKNGTLQEIEDIPVGTKDKSAGDVFKELILQYYKAEEDPE